MQFYTSIGLHVFRNVIRSITGCSTMKKRKRERTRERDNLTFKFEKKCIFLRRILLEMNSSMNSRVSKYGHR